MYGFERVGYNDAWKNRDFFVAVLSTQFQLDSLLCTYMCDRV